VFPSANLTHLNKKANLKLPITLKLLTKQ